MTIKSKILVLLIPLIVLPMVLLSWIAYKRLRSGVRQMILAQMKTVPEQAALHTQSKIRIAEANIELFACSHQLTAYILTADAANRYGLMQPALLRLFASYQKAYPEYYELRVLLPDGYEDVKLTSVRMPDGHDEAIKTEIFKTIASAETSLFSRVVRQPATGRFCFLISKRLSLLDKSSDPVWTEPSVRGYLTVAVDLSFMNRQVHTTRIGETGCIFYIDHRGTILFHPDAGRLGTQLPEDLRRDLERDPDSGRLVTAEFNDRTTLFTARQLHPNLFLVAMLPEDELSDATRSLGTIVTGITLLTIFLVAGLSFLLLNQMIVHPIRKLTQAVQTMGKGDLTVRVSIDSMDEIGILSSEVNAMAAKLSQLTVSRDYMENILRSMNEALLVVSGDGIIETVNRSSCMLLGYEKTELIGRPLTLVFPENSLAPIMKLKRNGRIDNVEKTIRKKNQTDVPVLFSGAVMRDEHRNIRRITCLLRDITAFKQAENEKNDLKNKLHRSQKMEALGMLAGGVAHDLNNILSGIVSYPELLLLDLSPDSPMRNPIVSIKKSGEKAAAVVQDLLTLARRGVKVTEVVNLNQIVSGYLKSPEYRKLETDHPAVHMETRLDEHLLDIKGSPVHLTKTLMNLVSNAEEAMPEGGRIVVTTENRYVDHFIRGFDEMKEGEYAVLSVSDSGIGIAGEDIERIFEPFYTKKKMGKSGSGLGMAVVWGTVKDHHGYIDVDSFPGNGTRFSVFFPVTRDAAALPPKPYPMAELMGNGESVLVVDDIQEQRDIATGILERLGYRVTAVAGGEQALAYLASGSADLVLLDMIMEPGMDGLDTYRQIIEIRPNQKAIVASGFSETDRVRKAQALGIGQYIKKPYSLSTIGLAVKSVLEN